MTTFAIDFDATSLAETQFSFAEGVATLTLHNPDLRNAISTVMLAELIYLLEWCGRHDAVRVVVQITWWGVLCQLQLRGFMRILCFPGSIMLAFPMLFPP